MLNQNRLVQTLMELVQIDSPSNHEAVFRDYCAKKLESLGAQIKLDSYGNLFAYFAGEGKPILLNCHLDTVEPGRNIKPHLEGNKIVTDGTTVLGGDPKSGIAVILETLTSLKEDKKPHPPLDVVLTLGEELGVLGAKHLDYSLLRAKKGITFDGEESITNVIIGAPGYNQIDVTVTGRSAHAGVEPENGISAIRIASEIISQLQLGRIDEETTANIGNIAGGSARSAVPETAHFEGEIRSRNIQKLANHSLHFQDIVEKVRANYPEAKIELAIIREFDPYLFSKDHPMLQKIVATLKELKLQPNLYASGGGTDVNIFQHHGIDAICLGVGTFNMHTKREYVDIDELMKAAQFCERIVQAE
ncbi:MAG: M20/M25/M40 family metallo-hydrolase [Candidatus Levyibacteriota bacterium]